MSDINILSNNADGFSVTFGDTASNISGNLALLNRFEITFFDEGVLDNYGGRAFSMIGTPRALSDISGITASITAAVNNTVESIKSETSIGTPDTEKLDKAKLASVNVDKGVISASIDIYPVELENNIPLSFNIPITSR